ncbi:NACHT domain- and WD repeat-containing protein 1 [Huso huso]|uniref:NACHT domain- and WD repeat-containing protein 1 n=1 Tax=Huso huso TaxID=61971 RepID=A0ABR0Y4H8_HUSHU
MQALPLSDGQTLDLLKGRGSGIAEEISNVVRVFISSTFTDMSTERDALLDKAYSELQAFCQTLGLVFEVVDMRWGVRDAIAVDHMTIELCLREIQSCQRVSVGPIFTALIGNRYGYRPIPRVIEEQEFELLLSKLSADESATQLLKDWFWKDENSVPPAYILQPITTHLPHYSDTRPESRPQHQHDVATWWSTETKLSRLLRAAAVQAEKEGEFSREQRHRFFKSVTEWEIEQGLLASQQSNACVHLFLRELPDLSGSVSQKSSSQFIDIKEDGCVDTEAQELLSSLKMKISSNDSIKLNVHTVQLSKGAIDPCNKTHAQYLQTLCEQFISEMKQQILRRDQKNRAEEKWAWLLQEVSHHMALSASKCAVFCGRADLLNSICETVKEQDSGHHAPLVVFGPSGIGKTSMMCKLSQEVRRTLGEDSVLVLRLLGTSPMSSEIHSVLKSVCFQICSAYGFNHPTLQTINAYEDLVRFFHSTLAAASQKKAGSLVLILDSLDQLSPADGAHRLHWLPKECPQGVHIIVSTLGDGNPILKVLLGGIQNPDSYFAVGQLSLQQGEQVIRTYMAAAGRSLTPAQHSLILSSFNQCGHPFLLKLALDAASQWASYTPLPELQGATSTKEAVSQLYERLEKQHGRVLVTHALGFIVSSRSGLTEAELRDVLSVDDEVLADIYQYWPPPNSSMIRLPPLLWTRLRYDLGEYLVERQVDGNKVLALYHRQFIEMVQERYLSAEQKSRRHHVLADFFKGMWSQGARKPICLPSLKTSLNADRKVASQPLWFTDNVANLRKLRELPFHLLHAGRRDELKHNVIGNMDWLVCKTQACGIRSVIEDLCMCAEHIDCPEVRLVRDAFLLFKPTVDFIEGQMDSCLLYTELLARLHFFADSYSLIGSLCSQCSDFLSTSPNPTFIPLSGFFQPPGGPLKTTLTGFNKGITVLELCSQSRLLLVGAEDGRMIVWNVNDTEVIHTLTGHTAEVQCVRVIGKGTRCVSGSYDQTLRVWSLVTGKQLHCIEEGPRGPQNCALLHVEEERGIIYSGTGAQLNAWQLETGSLLFCINSESAVFTVIPGGDEPGIALAEGGLLTLWDRGTGRLGMTSKLCDLGRAVPTCTLPLRTHRRLAAGFSDGSVLLISTDGRFDAQKVASSISFLVVSEDETVLCAGHGKSVAVFQLDPSAMERCFVNDLEHEDTVLTAAVGTTQGVLITGSKNEAIRVWSLSSGALLDSFSGMGVSVTALVLVEDTLISASRHAYYLKLWRLHYDPRNKTTAPVPACSLLTAVSHHGEYVYFLKPGDRKKVIVWDYLQGSSVDTIDCSAEVCCLEVAQLKKLLFCGVRSGTVLVYPLEFRHDAMCIPPPEPLQKVCSIGLSKLEDRLAVAYEDTILVFDFNPGKDYPVIPGPIHKLAAPQHTVSSIAVLSDCSLLCGLENGEVSFLKDSNAVPLQAHSSQITCIAISNQEIHALVGSQDSIQRLWNLKLGLLDHEMKYKSFFFEGILCAMFSQDDQYVYTGSHDRSIKVWHTGNGSLLAVQYVYTSVPRIVATSEGFIAVSHLGYIIKERFISPKRIRAQYNPLQNSRDQYTVTSRERAALPLPRAPAQQGKSSKPTLKRSQSCAVL